MSRLAYVVKRYPRYSETFIVNEILAHERAGIEIDIFALRHGNDGYYQDLLASVKAPVFHLPRLGTKLNEFWAAFRQAAARVDNFWQHISVAENEEDAYDVFQALILSQYIAERKIQHLHAHFLTSATRVAHLAAKLAGISYSVTAHAKDIYHEEVNESKIQTYIDHCQSLVTVSDYNLDYLKSRYRRGEKIHRVYNGLDLSRFAYYTGQKKQSTIVSVGRFVEKKGFEILIEACARLKDKIDFHCYLVGNGNSLDTYVDLIKRNQLEDIVEILGPRPQGELINLVRQATLLVAPCVIGEDGNRDGLPTVLLEAMALGTPCISTDVTGIPELIEHEKTGLLSQQGDAEDLAKNIELLINDEILRQQISRAGRERIEENFDIEKNTIRLREIILADLP